MGLVALSPASLRCGRPQQLSKLLVGVRSICFLQRRFHDLVDFKYRPRLRLGGSAGWRVHGVMVCAGTDWMPHLALANFVIGAAGGSDGNLGGGGLRAPVSDPGFTLAAGPASGRVACNRANRGCGRS